MKQEQQDIVCKWVGNGEKCRHPSMYNKSYCETHYNRVYMLVYPEMANFIIEKELKSIIDF